MFLSLPPRRRLTRELRRRLPFTPPLVTVVVPFFNVREYLRECVDSILRQTLTDLEVILVDDGSTDGSHDIAASYAAKDKRVRVVAQVNQGPGAARNTGVAHAKGTYLSFVDSDDRLPVHALQVLVDSARENNADIAAGAIRRFNSTRSWVPAWAKGVHSESRKSVRLNDFPQLLRNNYPVAKVYKRRFWRDQELSFRIGVIYEDQPLIAQMLSRANKINVLSDIVYDYRAREDRSSISQRPEELTDLQDRAEAWRLSLDVLSAEAAPEVLRGWYHTVYGTHFHWYLNNAAVADPVYWDVLAESARDLLRHEPSDAFDRISPEKRIALRLLQSDQQQALLDFRNAGGYELSKFGSRIKPEGLEHALPITPQAAAAMPAGTLITPPDQFELRQEVVRGEWRRVGASLELRLSGFAFIDFLDLQGFDTHIELFAANRDTGETFAANVVASDDPTLRPAERASGFSTAGSGYTAVFKDVAKLASGSWALFVRVTTGSFATIEPLRNLSSKSGFAEEPSQLTRDHIRVRVLTSANRHVGISLVVDRPAFVVERVESYGRNISVRFHSPARRPLTVVLTRSGVKGARARARVGAGGDCATTIALPDNQAARRRSWDVGVLDLWGRVIPLVWSPELQQRHTGAGQVLAIATAAGTLRIEDCPFGYILVEAASAGEPDGVQITGTVHAADAINSYEFRSDDNLIETRNSLLADDTTLRGVFALVDRDVSVEQFHAAKVTARASSSGGHLSGVPVILGKGVLAALPLASPRSRLVLERAKERTLSLRLTKESHSEGTMV